MKILKRTFVLLLPLLFIFSVNNNVEAASFGYDYKEKRGVFSYTDISAFLARVGGEVEVTFVDLEGNKDVREPVPAQEEGLMYFNQNGTYTIRLLLPNGRTIGYKFYQTIYTQIPLQ